MKTVAIASLALAAFGCSRTSSETRAAPPQDASVPVPAVAVEASVAPVFDAGVTLDAYCAASIASGEELDCRGDKVHPSCSAQQKKKLPTLGGIVLVVEKTSDRTEARLVLVDPSGHFSTLERVRIEDCDTGEPADVSLELVSANESEDAGVPTATIVFDSLRNDPPYQSGPRVLSGERRSVHCRAGTGAPQCDKPTTLGTFTEPGADKPPPFSQWKRKN